MPDPLPLCGGALPQKAPTLYRPVRIGSLELPGNLFLAPLAGYTDSAFRSICRAWGADFSYTELISAEAVARHSGPLAESKSWHLLRRGAGEFPYGVQLFGASPEAMYRAALALAECGPELVDINCGCPVPKVVKTGAGAALMRDPVNLGRIVAAVVKASREALGSAPVTVKLRSGWDSASINYREAAQAAIGEGAALITLHPRTKAQGYGGRSDWACIGELAAWAAVPVAGSGDLYTPEDAARMLEETGCAAVMFARGAMGNPLIFAETRRFLSGSGETAGGGVSRIALGYRHLLQLAEDIGEKTACREMRKHFSAYTKGMPGGNALRAALVRCETLEEYRRILKDIDLEGQ